MHKRKLGQLEVSAVGLGCLGLSGVYGSADEVDGIATIRRALELGVTFLDTADFYGTRAGENEILIGRALQGQSVRQIASEKGVTPSQLAIAWVLAQGQDIVPILGTKRVKYLEENVAAADIQLSKHDLERIEQVAPKGIAAGERYPAAQMGLLSQ